MAAKPRREKRKHSVFYYPLLLLVICALLVLGLSVFFRVSHVEVSGNRVYTAEEVVEASGIQEGDNLFFINRIEAAARIRNQLSYVDSVSIRRAFPGTVEITVTESKGMAYLVSDGAAYVIDSSGKILSEANAGETEGLIQVKGLTLVEPEAGAQIQTEASQSACVTFLQDLLQGLENNGMEGDVTWVDMSNVSSPSFDYLGRFTVNFGSDTDVDYKFLLLLSAIEEMEPGDSGILDLSEDGTVHLKYD